MPRLPSFAVILGVLGCATAALADSQATVDQYFEPWSGPKGLDTLRHLATCVADRHPASAQRFIRSLATDLELRANSKDLMDPNCIKMFFFKNSNTRIAADMYGNLLAESLLNKSYSASNLPSLAGVAALDQPALPDVPLEQVHKKYREMFALDKVLVKLERSSECIARSAPPQVLTLAGSKPSSPEEAAAFSALDGATVACGGDKLAVNIPVFARRASLVSNLYRLADAASPVTLQEANP